ncbi:MAG: hypothetical protein QNJ54_07705 [Prochloraceae cyanobacterium]|nr:hypothetical protein [Prochloraceae cyanobacterium]
MKDRDLFKDEKLKRLELSIYLTPIIGVFPSLWKLYIKQGDMAPGEAEQSPHSASLRERDRKNASRLSVTLAAIWLIAYSLLWLGTNESSQILTFRLLYINSLLTSGYFLTCIVLIVRLWQGKSLKLPGISQISDKISTKTYTKP